MMCPERIYNKRPYPICILRIRANKNIASNMESIATNDTNKLIDIRCDEDDGDSDWPLGGG